MIAYANNTKPVALCDVVNVTEIFSRVGKRDDAKNVLESSQTLETWPFYRRTAYTIWRDATP